MALSAFTKTIMAINKKKIRYNKRSQRQNYASIKRTSTMFYYNNKIIVISFESWLFVT